MKDLYSDVSKTLMKKIKEDTNKWNVSCVHGLEELISLKYQCYQNLATDFIQSLSRLQWHYFFFFFFRNRETHSWASLVVQWIRINLPMQGIWIQSPVQEDSTCCEATEPMYCYWAQALESRSGNYWGLCAATHVPRSCNREAITVEACAPQQRIAPTHNN